MNIFKICQYAGFSLLLISNSVFAGVIKIEPNTVVSSAVKYHNVTLDMSKGSFIIQDNGSLTIKNSVINGTLSLQNPLLINVANGNLDLDNTQVNIQTKNLPQHPQTQSLQNMIQVGQGSVVLHNNTFSIDNPFTAGLLITSANIPTTGFNITGNTFNRFHGVLYLITSDNSVITGNTFNQNSYGHIVIFGNQSLIDSNSIYFSGNYNQGNSIDIVDSNNITIKNNFLFTPTCHGIYVINSSNMVINHNRITGGITYAMNLFTNPESMKEHDNYLLPFRNIKALNHVGSTNISVTHNYMSQNRYGIAATDISNLTINDNTFIQRFSDDASRQFWTNNNVLLQNVSNLTWGNNLYKEAYTQEINGDNSKSSQFVPYPQSGGVVFSRR